MSKPTRMSDLKFQRLLIDAEASDNTMADLRGIIRQLRTEAERARAVETDLAQQLENEQQDVRMFADHATQIYSWASGGRITKPNTYPYEVISVAEDLRMKEIDEALNDVSPTQEQWEWVISDDTGLSSKTIWSTLTGQVLPRLWASVPWDSADFGRCYRLLMRFPEWRARLPEVAAAHSEWKPLVARWDELTALYEAEGGNNTGRQHPRPRLNTLMRTILETGHNEPRKQ
jgi:hypothetical protein